jgi:catechol 2,3-dioxygenase-like lactoylglutathione lyase family enzyme
MLRNAQVAATLPVVDMDRARDFYEGVLELEPVSVIGNNDAVIYACGGGTLLNIYRRPTPTKADHTAASWSVDDIEAAVEDLVNRGVVFEQYNIPEMGLKTDSRGIADMGGELAAWFKDPEGNILAIFQL